MAIQGIKPTDFPPILTIDGTEEVYTQSGGVNGKFTVQQIIDLVPLSSGGTQTFSQTLVFGNETDGNDIRMSDSDVIKSVNGSGQLDLRAGTNNSVELTANGFANGWVAAYPNYASLGYNNNYFTVDATSVHYNSTVSSFAYMSPIQTGLQQVADILTTNYGIAVAGDATGAISFNATTNTAVSINSGSAGNPTIFNTGVNNSVALGGVSINVKTPDSAYGNRFIINTSGSAFETIISNIGMTSDRLVEFPNASGQVRLINYVAVVTPTVHTAANGEVVTVSCLAGALLLNLPSASVANQLITIKKVDAGVLTIIPNGIETIDGAASYGMGGQYESATFVSTGFEWLLIASF